MTDAVLWSVFVALLSGALYFAWPRAPGWDPVTFHHVVLATLLRGEVEAVDGKLEDWKARLDVVLPRGPRPPSGGWTEDPDHLGAAYDPVVRLGADATWDALAAGAPPVEAALVRRLADVRLVWVGEPAVELPGLGAHRLDEPDLASLLARFPDAHLRFVLATRDQGQALLVALRDAPAVRDRVRACVFVGARFDPAWLATSLTHVAFDTEVDRTVPWFVLRAEEGADTGLVEPEVPATGRRSIAVHDLGIVTPSGLAEPAAARALALLLAAIG
jgi:hypothetical protein